MVKVIWASKKYINYLIYGKGLITDSFSERETDLERCLCITELQPSTTAGNELYFLKKREIR